MDIYKQILFVVLCDYGIVNACISELFESSISWVGISKTHTIFLLTNYYILCIIQFIFYECICMFK